MPDKVPLLLELTFWCGEIVKNESERKQVSKQALCAREKIKQERVIKTPQDGMENVALLNKMVREGFPEEGLKEVGSEPGR